MAGLTQAEVVIVNGKEQYKRGSSDGDKIKAVSEFRKMAGLTQAEVGTVAGVVAGVSLDASALALLGRALMAYEGEVMAVDVESHDVVDVDPDERGLETLD